MLFPSVAFTFINKVLGLHVSQHLVTLLHYLLFLMNLFYVIYLNMVGNKCFFFYHLKVAVVCESWKQIKDTDRLPAAGGAAAPCAHVYADNFRPG